MSGYEAPGGGQSGGSGGRRWAGGWGGLGAAPRPPPAGGRPCSAKDFGHGSLVCVCSAAYCDTVEPVVLPSAGSFVKYESTKAGKRLQRSEGSFQRNAPSSGIAAGVIGDPSGLGKIGWCNQEPVPPCPKIPNPS